MRARIAAVLVAAAGMTATIAAPSWAASAQAPVTPATCAATTSQPCLWKAQDATGVAGMAQIAVEDFQPTLIRVELKTQRAWGSPWLTVATTSGVSSATFTLATPKVATTDRSIVCATTGPALDVTRQITTCTAPY
ncbi:hypothetical protein [Kitasatospora sp. McL0602]|uniref:hypothetical protein n=1 Tax=Kitasatospora sp. McL0602 TaxID=3439530 RepID=UPI003F8B7F5E